MRHCLLFTVVAALLAGSGCSSSNEPAPDPPAVPSRESLAFDIGFFQRYYTTPEPPPGVLAVAHNSHFQAAALRALLIGTPIEGIFGAMLRVLGKVEGVPAEYTDGVHRWMFTARPDGIDKSFVLSAESAAEGDGIEWRLAETDGRLWLTGVQDSERRGTWVLYNRFLPETLPQFEVQWEIWDDGSTLLAQLIQEGTDEFSLAYTRDRYYRVLEHITKAGNRTLVAWDEESREGRMEAFDFHQGIEACWTYDLQDGYCRTGAPGL